ncbi:MAG: hypothetical protein ACF8OB_01600 [Phycisphaeraceae bacterium JB051]
MEPHRLDIVISQWARIGLFIGEEIASTTPHLEQLIIDTARAIPNNARLFYAIMSWLSQYGVLVNVGQLQKLLEDDLASEHHPALAALIALSVKHGAPSKLMRISDRCEAADNTRPLFISHQHSVTLKDLAKQQACSECLKWNIWVTDQNPLGDILRPLPWILKHNPEFKSRLAVS